MNQKEMVKLKVVLKMLKKHRNETIDWRDKHERGTTKRAYYLGGIDNLNYAISAIENNFIAMPVQFFSVKG